MFGFCIIFFLSLTSVYTESNHTLEDSHHDKRIRGGHNIEITQAKYYVYVTCGTVACGGTLVRQNKVITAGHCVDSCAVGDFQIAAGLNSLNQEGLRQATTYRASAINIHPRYNKNNPFPYDVAVVTLSQNVQMNDKVGTINYATSRPPLLHSMTVVGYGDTNTNEAKPEKLQRADVRIVGYSGTNILTNALRVSTLPGDSGGPAVFNGELAGITSGYYRALGVIIKNIFVAVGHPEILSFIRTYAP